MRRAAIYDRVSTRDLEQGTSLDTQEAACRRFAAERGLEVAPEHVYAEVHTGVELWERPKLSALRQVIRQRQIDHLIAYAIDRLSRDPVHLGVILTEADYHGVEVSFVSEPLDASLEGQLIRYVRGYAAKVEHEKIKERTMRGKLARLQSGRILPGCKPKFGYAWTSDRSAYVVDSETAPIAIRIKDEFLQGRSTRSICAGLIADGVPTPARSAHGIWQACTIRSILIDPAYAGRPAGMRKRYWKERGKIKMAFRVEADQTPLPSSVAPALWSWTEHGAILARCEANKALSTRNNQSPWESLLRGGYIRCSVCGTRMHVKPKSKTSPLLYQCTANWGLASKCRRQSIHLPTLDAAVWQSIQQILTEPEIIAAELERQRWTEPNAADLAGLNRTLAGLDRQMRTLIEQLSIVPVGSSVADLVLDKLRSLEEQRNRLNTEQAAAEDQVEDWRTRRSQVVNVIERCRRVAKRIEHLSYEERREAVFMLGVKVNVWPKSHPDKPDDVQRWEVQASIPLDPDAAVLPQVVYASSTQSTA